MSSAMAYDAVAQRMVLLAGGTWLLVPALAAAPPYGSACAGAGGAPALTAFGRPALGNPSFALDVGSSPPFAAGVVLLSAGQASIPIGPCTLLVGLTGAALVPAPVNSYGFGSVRLGVPYQASWLGATLFAQAGLLDASAPLGFTLTNGLALVVGE